MTVKVRRPGASRADDNRRDEVGVELLGPGERGPRGVPLTQALEGSPYLIVGRSIRVRGGGCPPKVVERTDGVAGIELADADRRPDDCFVLELTAAVQALAVLEDSARLGVLSGLLEHAREGEV